MAMNIHMSTRFLQLKKNNPNIKKSELIFLTSQKMFWPIIYTVLTTICAFFSLIFSEIKPIIDFGWMMTFGLIVFFCCNVYLASNFAKFLEDKKVSIKKIKIQKLLQVLSDLTLNNKNLIFFSTFIMYIFISFFGISKLEVENSFINYFKKNTEIYKGMKLIDDKLGGTTPLDIIIKFPISKIDNSENEEDWDDDGGR